MPKKTRIHGSIGQILAGIGYTAREIADVSGCTISGASRMLYSPTTGLRRMRWALDLAEDRAQAAEAAIVALAAIVAAAEASRAATAEAAAERKRAAGREYQRRLRARRKAERQAAALL